MKKAISNDKKSLKAWFICSLGAIFFCYEYLLRIQPSIIVPELMQNFRIGADQFGAMVGLYYLAYTPMQLVVGIMVDIYQLRYILTFAVFLCVVGSFMFVYPGLLAFSSLGRFLIGFGSAFAFVSALKLASFWLPENRFAFFSGLVTGLGMLGGIIGNVALTHLVHLIGWRPTLYLSPIFGLILLPFIWFLIQNKNQQNLTKRPPNFKTAFRKIRPQLTEILKNKEVWKTGIIGSVLFLSLSLFAELWGISFLREVYHLSPSQAAFCNSLIFLGWLVGAPLNGLILDRTKRGRPHLILGGMLSFVTITFIIFLPQYLTHSLEICLFLFGLFSSCQLICFAVGRELCPKNMAGTAVSFINVLVMAGGILLQYTVGLALHYFNKHFPSIHSYQIVFSLLPLFIGMGIVIAIYMKEPFEKKKLKRYTVNVSPEVNETS